MDNTKTIRTDSLLRSYIYLGFMQMIVIAETYWELFRNRPHWFFELTVELVTFVFATLPIRWWLVRHDKDHPTKAEFKILLNRVTALEAQLLEKELSRKSVPAPDDGRQPDGYIDEYAKDYRG